MKQARIDGTFDMGILGRVTDSSSPHFTLLDLGMESDRVQKKESRQFRGTGKLGDFLVEMHKISLLRSVSW